MNQFLTEEIASKANKWSGRNPTRWSNEEYDRTYKAAESEMDPVKRAAMFIKMNDLLIAERRRDPGALAGSGGGRVQQGPQHGAEPVGVRFLEPRHLVPRGVAGAAGPHGERTVVRTGPGGARARLDHRGPDAAATLEG